MYTGSVLTWGYSSPGWELLEGKDWVWVLPESPGHRMGLERVGNGIELGIEGSLAVFPKWELDG